MKVITRCWRYLVISGNAVRTAGWKASAFFVVISALLVVSWILVEHDGVKAARYTDSVFIGSLAGTLLAFVFLATSRHLRFLAKNEQRARLENAGIALIFTQDGHLILHYQDDTGDTSWPSHWVPPGGLASGDTNIEAAKRLKLLVDDHDWKLEGLVASTNDSKRYRDIVRSASQTPVQVKAYWFRWSDSEAFIPADAQLHDGLVSTTAETIPGPMPPYYPELLEYIDALRDGKQPDRNLKYWQLHDCEKLGEALAQLVNQNSVR